MCMYHGISKSSKQPFAREHTNSVVGRGCITGVNYYDMSMWINDRMLIAIDGISFIRKKE